MPLEAHSAAMRTCLKSPSGADQTLKSGRSLVVPQASLSCRSITCQKLAVHITAPTVALNAGARNLTDRAVPKHTRFSERIRRRVACNSMTASQGVAYRQPGPYRTYECNPITIRVGGDDELPITAQIMVTMPVGAPSPAPLVVISAGFLLNASLYESYAKDLASWGYAVAMYDVSEVMDDKGMVNALRQILDLCMGGDPQLRPLISNQGAALIGHSRGGKLSCLTAALYPNKIKGLILFDPVDNTPMTPGGEGYPSALPGLAAATSGSRPVPVLVIGAGMGGDVVPESANYKRFTSSCRGPVWEVELSGCAHLSFLDKQVGLFTLFSQPGSTPDAFVRAASKVGALTWLQHVVFPLPGASPLSAVDAAQREISNMVKGAARMSASRLSQIPSNQQYAGSSSAQGRGSDASGNDSSNSSSSSGRSGGRAAPVTETYEQLMSKRAKELKAMLIERGIKCDDCFEKEQLAKRLVETCTVAA